MNNFFRKRRIRSINKKNRFRFSSIITDKRFNYLESIYRRLLNQDPSLSDQEVLDAYHQFSSRIQTNTISAAELEWVAISVLCYFRPHLVATLIRSGLLCIVMSLGENINASTIFQFIETYILDALATPYGGWPPTEGMQWLKEMLPLQKEMVQQVLDDVIRENQIELEKLD